MVQTGICFRLLRGRVLQALPSSIDYRIPDRRFFWGAHSVWPDSRAVDLVEMRSALKVVICCALGLLVCTVLSAPHCPRGRRHSYIVISVGCAPIVLLQTLLPNHLL
jgi:hypothetical protein